MTPPNDRLHAAFTKSARHKVLIPYIAAGDPSIRATPLLMHALVEAGADILELGVPFSDPMADGPVIQRAAERAIAAGTGLVQVLAMVSEFRQRDSTTPVVLMGYANPIERMGEKVFTDEAQKAGVDGVLVVDYPPEEAGDFIARLENAGIAPIFLLAPTSTEARIKRVGKIARGYVYYVSLKGVTGAGHIDFASVAEHVERIRRHVSVPVGVGFGISDADSARRVAEVADAVVIGSKLIGTMEAAIEAAGGQCLAPHDRDSIAIRAAQEWLGTIRQALD